ncbi:alkene reductase [Ensifer adhaerens]|uniref:alkene reductase n=1 Tax=Ensifer adhaerens TaxID=106592 RepID=UPI001CC0CE77|nr:alkene reductase [Ensifer adhaerens]MBZ7924219.1 alkene reductase [Ensifer adhaerens]UAX96527.1 alkene reductase [Ensifer adhaerens]UAY04129.1 alkene reductase [Ensifer adhaerens]UAY12115.1 alkene reductase [Ensifer adhaerens]
MSSGNSAGIFSSFKLGGLDLPSRIVMAPMTRSRAGDNEVPLEIAATYYEQRASAGLIISEGTQISRQGLGYPGTPGIHSDEQVAGWQKVTSRVHDAGGRIFAQLWHVGRISHPSLQPDNGLPVGPSAIQPAGEIFTFSGMQPFVTPRALELSEIKEIIDQYKAAAENAKRAGFDGVELHGANGYLIDQFIRDKTNRRTDAYGGTALNRVRLLLEATDALIDVWGAERVGVRLSPTNPFNDIADSHPADTFAVAVRELASRSLAYLHVVEPQQGHTVEKGEWPDIKYFRRLWDGVLMANGGYTLERANQVVNDNAADLISFGAPFLANPDLPYRFKVGAALNAPDQATFYTGGEKGYIDYPTLHEASA